MNYTKKERERYNERRQGFCKKFNLTKSQYNALRRVSEMLADADTNYVNGTKGNKDYYAEPVFNLERTKIHNEYTEADYIQDVNAAIKKAEALKVKYGWGFNFYHQTDPRGTALYISTEPITSDNYQTGDAIH